MSGVQVEGEVDLPHDYTRRAISDLNSPLENALGLLEDLLNNILPGQREVETVRDQLLTTSDLRSPVHADRWLAKRRDLSPQARQCIMSVSRDGHHCFSLQKPPGCRKRRCSPGENRQ